MIVDERMRTYINSLDMGNTPFLEELEQYAIRERVPIIRREMQSFIKMFLAVNRPKRILEVGTAIGFSTLLMCEYGPEDLEIVTIENYEKRIPISGIALLPEHLEGMGRNKFGHQKAYGSQDNDHQCNPEVFGEHEDQCSDDRYDSGKKLGKSKQHTIG